MIQITTLTSFTEMDAEDATILYYSQEWLNLITAVYKHRIISLLTINQAGQIIGFLPLCLMRIVGT
jgi:hypothetical protein